MGTDSDRRCGGTGIVSNTEMMESLSLYRVSWHEAYADKLIEAAGEHDMPDIKLDIISGRSQLYLVEGSLMVLRIEKDELVIICYVGDAVVLNAELFFRDIDKIPEIKTVRFHTQKPGVGRMLERLGFVMDRPYYIFRRDAKHGRKVKIQ